MATKKRLPYGEVTAKVLKAQEQGCTTTNEIRAATGLTYQQVENVKSRLRRQEGAPARPAREIGPERPTPFSQEEAEGLRQLLAQQERKAEISALRSGRTVLTRVDSGLLEVARQHAKQHRLALSEILSNALESYLSAITQKAGGEK